MISVHDAIFYFSCNFYNFHIHDFQEISILYSMRFSTDFHPRFDLDFCCVSIRFPYSISTRFPYGFPFRFHAFSNSISIGFPCDFQCEFNSISDVDVPCDFRTFFFMCFSIRISMWFPFDFRNDFLMISIHDSIRIFDTFSIGCSYTISLRFPISFSVQFQIRFP